MTLQEIVKLAIAILAALGGGGAIVLGLSGYLGKLWADRLMARERAAHEHALERLRSDLAARSSSDLERLKASVDLSKTKLIGAHKDKLVMYRMVTDIVAEMIVDLGAAQEKARVLSPEQALERMLRFERDRLRAYGYLAMLAPQHVMDAFDRVIDYLLNVLDSSAKYDFTRVRQLGIAMLNQIRIDLGVDVTPIDYHGNR